MHGPDVAEVQRLLGVDDDGDYGPETARAVADWKRARSVVPASRCSTRSSGACCSAMCCSVPCG